MTRIITLTSDFGYRDPYVGVMKGVILSHCSDCTLIDLTHGLTPHSVLEANFSIRRTFRYFPEGTLHVIVVDPGVGGERRILFLRAEGHDFLAPDNGVLTGLLENPEELRTVENRSLFLDEISNTFHGRDIFAPVAGCLCRGVAPGELGPELDDPITIQWSEPTFDGETVEGCIIYIDVFGNLVTNITADHIGQLKTARPRVFLSGREIGPPQSSYSVKASGEALAIVGSFGHLEIAVNEGNASEILGVGTGDEVIVTR